MRTQEELKKLTDQELEDQELNTCDRCGFIDSTYELKWISPDEDNQFSKKVHATGYDAVCQICFEIINQ